jgi:hypothetical protein
MQSITTFWSEIQVATWPHRQSVLSVQLVTLPSREEW